jgi:hypothetical protein
MSEPEPHAGSAEPGPGRTGVRAWPVVKPRWLIVGGIAVVSVVAAVGLVVENAGPPDTPGEVSEAWLDAFQARDVNAARELSCEELRRDLADPEIFEWTRLIDGSWTFHFERIDGDRAEIEAVRDSNGDATKFHLTRVDGRWQVCNPFDVQPNW